MEKNIRYALIAIMIAITVISCSKDYYHDSGTANGYHNGSMWNYLKSNPANFSIITKAIEKCDLIGVFDGTEFSEITFLVSRIYR
ncbi:MAG: hypothetical protein LIO65_02130 [Odoribacter sp.]|nr:hypothetical protein [Odoribacter sp.]